MISMINNKKNNLNIYDTMAAIIDHLGATARVVDNDRNNDKFIEFQVDDFPKWRFAAYDFRNSNVYIIGDRKDLIKRFEPFDTTITCKSVDEFLHVILNMKQDAIKYYDVKKNYEEDIDRILTEELNKNNILNGFGLLCHNESLDHLIIPVIHPDSLEKRNKLFSDAIRLRRKLLDCCIKHNKQLEDNKLLYLYPRLHIYWIPKLDLDYNIVTCIDRLYRNYKPYKVLTKEKRKGQNNRKLKRVRMINRVRRNISL